MKIALIGATGNAGTRLLIEALQRGHMVTAMTRTPAKLPRHPNLKGIVGDVQDEAPLAALLTGHEVVVSAYNPQRGAPDYTAAVLKGYQNIISATKKAGVKRLVVVGGAGSLEVAPGMQLMNTPNFPPEYKTEAAAFGQVLTLIRKELDLDWTYVSPSALFMPGARTGKFRLGLDQLLVAADGQSHISMEDFAVALLDEAEHPKHSRQRFTAGY
jgi:putative NADH-flavin reductase